MKRIFIFSILVMTGIIWTGIKKLDIQDSNLSSLAMENVEALTFYECTDVNDRLGYKLVDVTKTIILPVTHEKKEIWAGRCCRPDYPGSICNVRQQCGDC